MNHSVDTDAIIENAGTAANHHSAVRYRLPGKSNARAKVAQRDAILRSECPVELPDACRNGTMSSLRNRPRVVIVRHNVAGESGGVVEVGRGRRDWHGPEIAGPVMHHVARMCRQRSDTFA